MAGNIAIFGDPGLDWSAHKVCVVLHGALCSNPDCFFSLAILMFIYKAAERL